MGPRLQVIDELGNAPEDDQNRPELADNAPGMNLRVEILIKKDESDTDQRQSPENRSSTIRVHAHWFNILYAPMAARDPGLASRSPFKQPLPAGSSAYFPHGTQSSR